MALFLAGITLFCVVHLFPALGPTSRENLTFKLGENAYRGIFSLLILAGLVMIVFGWKATRPSPLYVPPLGPGILPSILVLAGLVLFFASQMKGHLKRTLRHPLHTARQFDSVQPAGQGFRLLRRFGKKSEQSR